MISKTVFLLGFAATAAHATNLRSSDPSSGDTQQLLPNSTIVGFDGWNVDVTVVSLVGSFQFAEIGKVSSGCGSDNQKCSCTVDPKNEKALKIKGTGTSFAPTGLDFTCIFILGETPCSIEVDDPLVGDNSLTMSCDGKEYVLKKTFPSDEHDIKGLAVIQEPPKSTL